ncbi:DNA-binding MarR family transcriptional regulator [Actinopolyspora lacussalsi]|uniref:DNA-binding transcriptional regulator, MarR family n=1 Tax=Actinopolyspora righensis TaxID=995060 RepID=A0A1I6XXT8_9ACTN|nr:MarR family transcriptional regulator [Actinopolyspora righensis]MDP9643694.1 DNA-binding MarR family transcriptional regulator [Actinopolyspora lacussalsi]SFT43130.1 DNA-binding transcriptional regulator, MarR family [Actinopolyspora righensis]
MRRTPDIISAARGQWKEIHPELDTSSMEIVGRVLRTAAVLRQRLDTVLGDEGLNRAEFDLLSALRRSGEPVTPGRLNGLMVASGAATTKRVQQLAERGLLERIRDQHDRRSARVRITDHGAELIDRAFARNLEAERELLAGMNTKQREAVSGGLAELLRSLEGPPAPAPPASSQPD